MVENANTFFLCPEMNSAWQGWMYTVYRQKEMYQLIEADTKRPTYRRQHFQIHFLELKYTIYD